MVAIKAAVEQTKAQYPFSQRAGVPPGEAGVVELPIPRHDGRMNRCARGWWSWGGRSQASDRRLRALLKCSGETVNHQPVHRVYREAGRRVPVPSDRHRGPVRNVCRLPLGAQSPDTPLAHCARNEPRTHAAFPRDTTERRSAAGTLVKGEAPLV